MPRITKAEREQMRADILEPVRALEIPRDELIIVGGAVLQLYGLKRTEDIDVVVESTRMRTLLAEAEEEQYRFRPNLKIGVRGAQLMLSRMDAGPKIPGTGSEYARALHGNISFMDAPHDDLYTASFAELHDEAEDWDGVLASPMQRIFDWKQAVGRRKDLEDLNLILAASST